MVGGGNSFSWFLFGKTPRPTVGEINIAKMIETSRHTSTYLDKDLLHWQKQEGEWISELREELYQESVRKEHNRIQANIINQPVYIWAKETNQHIRQMLSPFISLGELTVFA